MNREVYRLLDALEDVLIQACRRQENGGEILDSLTIRAYANALRILAEYGRVIILSRTGERILARPVPRLQRSTGTWEFLYLALGLTKPEWWQVFIGETLEDPVVRSLWAKMRKEKDPKRATSLLAPEERVLLERTAVKEKKAARALFSSCHAKAKKKLHERKAITLIEEMRKAPEDRQAELLNLCMEEIRRIKNLEAGGL